MRVFDTCLTIIKRRIGAFVLYLAIFIALSVLMPALVGEQFSTDFSAIKPNFTVINRDGETPLSEGLTAYLNGHGVEVALDDSVDAMRDASFYHATDYIAILPQGFHDAFLNGGQFTIETVVTTESAKGYYADSLVNQYLNQARMVREIGDMDEESLVAEVLNSLSAEAVVETVRFGSGAPVEAAFQVYSRMECYILIVLVILCISNMMSAFKRPDLRMRNLCAPLKPRSASIQQALCGVLVSVTAWALTTALGFVIYGGKLAEADGRIVALILLNSFIVTFVALSLAMLVTPLIKSPNSQNAVANFVSLGTCFLGGVFVPLEMMGDGILAVARFTPAYWYVTALDRIGALTSFGGGALNGVWQAMLVQLAFAAAFLCIALAVGKHVNQSERSFGSVRTELEP